MLASLLKARNEAMAPLRSFVEDYQASLAEQERLRKDLTHVERERDSLMLRLGVGDVRTSVETEQRLRCGAFDVALARLTLSVLFARQRL